MNDKQARDMLSYFLEKQPGALKFITSTHKCGIAKSHPDPVGEDEAEMCAEYEFDRKDPRHYELEEVVRIEAHPSKPHLVMAFTKQGSACVGLPADVLVRVAEWQYFDPDHTIETERHTMGALEATRATLAQVKAI